MKMYRYSLAAAILSILALVFGAISPVSAMSLDLPPSFTPYDEIRLQAVVREELPAIDAGSATLNTALREIDIRTALEDTARLHWELG